MKMSRRKLLSSVAAVALCMSLPPHDAKAFFPRGIVPSNQGWQVLPLGAGGLFTGFDIALDGSLVTRSDVGGVYRFTGTITQLSGPTKTWVSLQTNDSLKNSIGTGSYVPATGTVPSCYNIAMAPSLASTMYAIFPTNGGTANSWALFYSNDSGGTWKQTGYPTGTLVDFYFDPATNWGSAGPWRCEAYNIAVDPNNPSIAYIGTINSHAGFSGATAGAFVTFDGVNFNPVTTNGVTVIGSPQYEPGSNGILFDPNYTGGSGGPTTVVGGQTRTKRIMLPVSGQGIFESLDGGQTFTATDLTPFGRTDLTVLDMKMDFNGTCYAILSFGTNAPSGSQVAFWRYSGPGGVWESFTAQSSFPAWLKTSASPYGNTAVPLIVDPRSGQAGHFQICANGISTGFTSVNAGGPIASVTWTGSANPISTHLTAPSFDCPWLNHVAGTIGFVFGTACRIDPVTGYCVWTGNQGAFWLWTLSDLTTPTIPNWGSGAALYCVGTSRGTEATVAQDVLDAPGAPYPCIAAQDVGIFQSSLTPTNYPTDFWPSPAREDCETLEYAASDPSFYVGNVTAEVLVVDAAGGFIAGGANAGYSNNYGATGSWTKYTRQPTFMYAANIQGSISAGVLTVTSFNSVAGYGNFISTALNQYVYIGNTTYGSIVNQLSGPTGGTGTYQLTGSATVAGPVTFVVQPVPFVGGHVVAIDADHHISVPESGVGNSVGQYIPVYTTNARANPCTWNFTNLPLGQWMRRIGGYASGATSRPFAVGYGIDAGIAWAIGGPGGISSTVNLYKTLDFGATWTIIGTLTYSSNAIGIYLLSVPGYPGELWLAGAFSGGVTSCIYHITGANTGSATFTLVASPAAHQQSLVLSMGVPQSPGGYPTFYGIFWTSGTGNPSYMYQGTWDPIGLAMTWGLFGPTGSVQDLPKLQSTPGNGMTSIRGSWNKYQRVFVSTGNKGFAVYNPP